MSYYQQHSKFEQELSNKAKLVASIIEENFNNYKNSLSQFAEIILTAPLYLKKDEVIQLLKFAFTNDESNKFISAHGISTDKSEALKYTNLSKIIVEQKENNNLNPKLNGYKKDFYRIAAKIYVDHGNLDQALKYAVISTKDIVLDNDSKIHLSDISSNLTLIDILIRLERLEEAKQKLEFLKKAINRSLPREHIYQANIISYNSYVDALLGNIKIDQAIKENLAAQNLHKKLLGENYIKAEEEYSTGLKILTNIYNNDEAATDDLSYFHAKLAIINVKLQQPTNALKHLNTHHKIFGKQYKRSVQLIRYFVANKINIGM